jgi:hypothetical protein
MKTKSRKIPGIIFTGFLLLLFSVWLGSFLNFKSSLENLIPTLEFNEQKALASENDIEEAFQINLYNDTMYVENNTASSGDSNVWIEIGFKNDSIRVAGFEFKITYDTLIITPWYRAIVDTDVIVDTTATPDWDTTIVIDTLRAIDARQTERSEDLNWSYWSGGLWRDHLDTVTFIAGIVPGPQSGPILPKGRGPVVKIRFVVNPNATGGEIDSIRFTSGFTGVPLPNVWYDSLYSDYIPRTQKGIFTVSGEGPTNQCPVFDAPLVSTFEVNEGATLEFLVTAHDPDGDSLTLSMDPLVGYNPSFPSKKGDSLVTQTFRFSPEFGQGGATILVTFRAEDKPGCERTKTVSIQINETAQDVLFASSDQGGIPGSSGKMVPFIITNSLPIYGFQFTLRWDPTMVDVDSFVRTDVIEDFSKWDNLDSLGHSLGVATVLVFGFASQTIPAGIETVLYAAFSVNENATPGEEVTLQLENAREAINPGDPSFPLGMVHGKFAIDLYGDANIDREVDIADVVSVVAYILGNIDFTSREFMTADVVPNDTINVADLVGIINIILGRWTGPSPSPYSDSEPPAIVRLDYEDLQPGTTGELKVLADLEVPVAGAQIEINYDPEQLSFEAPRLSDWSDKFIAEYKDDKQGKFTALLYNLSNDPISPGEGSILSLPVAVSPHVLSKIKLEIGEVVLSDQNAVEIPVDDGKISVPQAFELSQNYPNPFNPTTTIKYTLTSLGNGEESLPTTLKIYNILGEVVRTLVDEPKSAGVHYEVWDGKDDQGHQVASGIYFYRLRAGEFSETKKMVLLK